MIYSTRSTGLACLLAVTTGFGCATQDRFDFRDDHRPEYTKAIDTNGLEQADKHRTTILDVRLPEDFKADPVLIPGAHYRNPDNIESWFSEIPRDTTIVVYCVRGKWVSQKAANFLATQGYDTYTLEGGIAGWQSAGNPVTASK